LRGSVSTPDLYTLKISDVRGGIQIFLDNSNIKVVAFPNDLAGAEVTGSATHNDLAGFNKLSKTLMGQLRKLDAEFSDAEKAKKTAEMRKIDNQMEKLKDKMIDEKLDYIKGISKSPVAPYLLFRNLISIQDPSKVEKLLNGFDPSLADYKYVKMVKESLSLMKRTAVGQVAPDFTQNDPEDKPVKLSDFRGQYVLIDFWASWCSPCRQENPNVVSAFNKYKDKNFTILGVSLDRDKAAWIKAIKEDKLTWTHVSDVKYWDNEVAKMYGIGSIPANLLLDKDGKIIGKNLRGEKLEEALAKFVK